MNVVQYTPSTLLTSSVYHEFLSTNMAAHMCACARACTKARARGARVCVFAHPRLRLHVPMRAVHMSMLHMIKITSDMIYQLQLTYRGAVEQQLSILSVSIWRKQTVLWQKSETKSRLVWPRRFPRAMLTWTTSQSQWRIK